MTIPLAAIPGALALLGLAGAVMWDSVLLAWLGGLNLVLAAMLYVTGDIE